MLRHFRKYQQYIYIVVTVVIVISFSFFGTYGTLMERSYDQGQAFIAINGTSISNAELSEYERFFSSDSVDKYILGGIPGPNFLNDGVIAKDIFEKKLAFPLFKELEESIGDEVRSRFLKEKNFRPYKNPKTSFLSAENTWNYFLPEINSNLALLKNAEDPFDENAFQAKIFLYLAQRKIPEHYLKQLLHFQETQYGDKFIDRELNSQDLSLFGYRNLEEWFGQKFIKALSAFVINASMIAEEKGYVVTKEEAQADLMRLALKSFKENQESPYISAKNVNQYFQEQLRHLHMDQATAIKIWQRALLFKRIMQDISGSVFIPDLLFVEFHQYTGEEALGTLYALPDEFKLRTPRDLELLEVYLEAIGSSESQDTLSFPKKLKKIEDIAKEAPELVQNGVVLEIAKVTEGDLMSRIGLKEMWRWQVSDSSWNRLIKQFPELGLKSVSSTDQRQAVLDSLDNVTKQRINLFSKKEILKEHPLWTQESLRNAPYEEMSFTLSRGNGKSPLPGISSKELMEAIEKSNNGDEPLSLFSKDGETHYRIKVKEIQRTPKVLSFAEAKKEGFLDAILDAKLKLTYEKVREASPKTYQNPDGTWKSLSLVESTLVEDLFSKTFSSIRKYLKAPLQNNLTIRDLVPYRLVGYVEEMRKNTLEKGIQEEPLNQEEHSPIMEQWKLKTTPFVSSRSSRLPPLLLDMQGLTNGSFSQVITQPEGDVYFFFLKEKGVKKSLGKLAENAFFIQTLLGSEAEKKLFDEMLKKMIEKDALPKDQRVLSP